MSVPFQIQADTWFFPPSLQSSWFAQVDWYLNWQMSKGLSYSGFHMPTETLNTAQNFEIAVPETLFRQSPLLVSTQGRIPANQCVVVEAAFQLDPWLKHISKLADGLKSKSIVIFLPRGVLAEAAKDKWSKLDSSCTAEFITDGETTT